MNLLHIAAIFPKISETFVLDPIIRLSECGWDGHILALLQPADLRLKDRDTFVQQEVQAHRLLEKTVYCKDVLRKIRGRLWLSSDLVKILAHSELILSHFANGPAEIAAQLAEISGAPFVFFVHARDIYVAPDIAALKLRAARAAQIIVPTAFNRDYLARQLGEVVSGKISVVRYGIDTQFFSLAAAEAGREDGVLKPLSVLCSVGRLVEKKGFEYTLRAFAQARRRHPNLRLKIIGDGPLRGKLTGLARALNLGGSVTFTGYLDRWQVRQELAQSDLFILPSITARNGDCEGLPVSILEASAMSLPVISTWHTGIPEGVVDQKTGLLVEEKDILALSECISCLAQDAELRQEMGANGRKHIVEHFDAAAEIQKLVAVLEQTVQRAKQKEMP